MINFNKLFNEIMPENDISIYTLYTEMKIARSQIYRLKSSNVQIQTVNMILQLLYEKTGKIYQLSDICEFIPDHKKK